MTRTNTEQIVDFLLGFLPNFLPKPVDSAAKAAIDSFRAPLDGWLKEPRVRAELMQAARTAESEFRRRAQTELKNDDIAQAVASFPIFDRELFQAALGSLPGHLREEYIAQDLRSFIEDDWKGKFSPEDLRAGVALYLNCLRVELLKVDGFADLVVGLAALRTDQRTEKILALVTELLQLVRLLIEKEKIDPQSTRYALFTIPPPVTDFTGRDEELQQLKASFSSGAIITGLSGSGGIGKTELARTLAREIAEDYPDARLNIDLLGTSEKPIQPEDAMRALLLPFLPPGAKLPDDEAQLRGVYQQVFSTQKALLLLDNAADAAQVRPLIPPAPSAAIITSRRFFSFPEYGLREPLRLDLLPLDKAVEYLRGASPKLADAPAALVTELAGLCGRLPLALRVAASLLNDRPDWSAQTLADRLQDEHTRLKRLKREGDVDVEAALNLSYDLLDDGLKKQFRALGIFTAPFPKISLQAVLQIEDQDEADEVIGKLTGRSLLNYQPIQGVVNEVYSLHDLTRLHAFEKMRAANELQETLTRHAEHFLSWAAEANDLFLSGKENTVPGLLHFRFIWAHLISGYERLLPEKIDRPQNADRWLSDFPGRCVYVLDLHLPPRENINILLTALEASRRLEDKQAIGAHLGNLGNSHAALGDARKAIEFYEQALVIDREIGDRRSEGASLGNLGNSHAALGDARKAIEFYEQQLVIVREIGDRRGEGNALGNLGNAYDSLGDVRKAIEFYEQQLVIVREIGDRRGEGAALGNLGNAYYSLGDARKAIEFYEQCLNLHREIGDRRGEGNDLGNLGVAYKNLGDVRKAIEFYEQQLVIVREIGDRRGEGNAFGNLGNAYYSLGDARKAIEFYEQQLVIVREIGDRRGEGNALGNLGVAYKNLGQNEKARVFWQGALTIFRDIESPHAALVEQWLAELDKTANRLNLNDPADLIRSVFQVIRHRDPQGTQIFSQLSKMMIDLNLSSEIQVLAKVLRDVMSGIRNPNLSDLSEELASLVREELQNK